MRNAKYIAFLLLGLYACQDQHLSYKKLESTLLVKLDGLWQAEGQSSFESWIVDQDTIYHGLVYEERGGDKLVKEVLKIESDGDDTYYVAWVQGQNAGDSVRFKLVGFTDKKMTFFNPKHDFLKKIEYEFLDDNHILATVSDGKGDMGKSFTIKYLRVMEEKKVTGIGGSYPGSRGQ